MSIEPNVHKGIPIEIIIKIKPEPYQRQDLRIYENKISLLDQYDRAIDEFITNGNIFEQTNVFSSNFDQVFRKYMNAIIQGINFSIFTFGSKSSGKTFSLEGNANESGLYTLIVENVFSVLDFKRDAILEEIQNLNIPEIEATSFSYKVRMKYIEIKDEALQDLLQKYNYYKQPTQLIYSESEGYVVSGAAWVNIPGSMSFPDLFSEASKFRSNFDYNKVNKSSTMMTFEVTQILENRSTRDVKHITSRVNIFDLASADILAEHFKNLSASLEYKSIYAFQSMISELAKSHNNALPIIYENSCLTKLMKEHIGGNSLCMGIFSLQNNNFTMSAIAFKIMKLCSHIQNFPIVNDSNSIGLLKKFRVDVAYYNKYKENTGIRLNEIKPPINAPLNELNSGLSSNDNQNEFKKRIHQLENENLRLKSDLEIQVQRQGQGQGQTFGYGDNFTLPQRRGLPPDYYPRTSEYDYPNDGYDINISSKLKHLDDDMDEINEIMNTVNQLHEKIKSLQEERRLIDEENTALKTNNTNIALELDKISMESNNYKTNADNELYSMKELLNSTKNELDYMRNEVEKYRKIQSDLMLELDEREVQYKKQLEDKEREIEMKMVDLSQNEKRRIESELRENIRKLEHFGQENSDYIKIVEELKKENNKLNLQIDEMRKTLREILSKGIDPSPKVKLIKTYSDRENELIEQLSIEKAKAENLKEKLKKMRTFGRKARNLALDYFPVNEEIPELLTKDIEIFLEDAENESVVQFLEFEIRMLREKNKKLEYENIRMKEDYSRNTINKEPAVNNQFNHMSNMNNQLNYDKNTTNTNSNFQLTETEIQRQIIDEINKLKTARPVSTSKDMEKLKNELEQLKSDRERLVTENKKLKTMINESLLSRDDNANPEITLNSSGLKQKIIFLEKAIQQLEKERTELSVRATIAEEQLNNFQELMNSSTQQYQKKILELNKRIETSDVRFNLRNNNNY